MDLKEYFQRINNGEDTTKELKEEEDKISIAKLLTGFHSFKKTLLDMKENEQMENYFLRFQLDSKVGKLTAKIQVLYKEPNGKLTDYTANESINSVLSKYTYDLHKRSQFIEAPNGIFFLMKQGLVKELV